MWPWLAAACVAALSVVILTLPREEAQQMAKVEETVAPQKEVNDTVKTVPMPRPSNEEKQLAELTDKQATTAKQKASVPTPKQKESTAEPTPVHNELAATDEPAMNDENIMAELPSQFKEMEAAFLSHSAPIRERGQQVMHRVAMLQQEQRNQQKFVEL